MNYKDINDYELVYLVKENDEVAESILYNKYLPVMKGIASKYYSKYKYTGIDYEDLLQEARIGFMKSLRSYSEDETLLYTYASLLIERNVNDYCKKYNTLKNYPLNFSVRDDYLIIEDNVSDDILCENETFFECKNRLDINYSMIFELRYNNFSYKEISLLLDLPITTVRGRMYQIRKKLEKQF